MSAMQCIGAAHEALGTHGIEVPGQTVEDAAIAACLQEGLPWAGVIDEPAIVVEGVQRSRDCQATSLVDQVNRPMPPEAPDFACCHVTGGAGGAKPKERLARFTNRGHGGSGA